MYSIEECLGMDQMKINPFVDIVDNWKRVFLRISQRVSSCSRNWSRLGFQVNPVRFEDELTKNN